MGFCGTSFTATQVSQDFFAFVAVVFVIRKSIFSSELSSCAVINSFNGYIYGRPEGRASFQIPNLKRALPNVIPSNHNSVSRDKFD